MPTGVYKRTATHNLANRAAQVKRFANPAERARQRIATMAHYQNPKAHVVTSMAAKTSPKAVVQRVRMAADPAVNAKRSVTKTRWWATLSSDERRTRCANWNKICRESARHTSAPSKAELKLLAIIQDMGFSRWTGGGPEAVSIGSKYPDFLHDNLPVAVELFGGEGYYHFPEEIPVRRAYFADYGYKLVVIWERELKHKRLVRQRTRQTIRRAGFSQSV